MTRASFGSALTTHCLPSQAVSKHNTHTKAPDTAAGTWANKQATNNRAKGRFFQDSNFPIKSSAQDRAGRDAHTHTRTKSNHRSLSTLEGIIGELELEQGTNYTDRQEFSFDYRSPRNPGTGAQFGMRRATGVFFSSCRLRKGTKGKKGAALSSSTTWQERPSYPKKGVCGRRAEDRTITGDGESLPAAVCVSVYVRA